jgi:hypothetical protein
MIYYLLLMIFVVQNARGLIAARNRDTVLQVAKLVAAGIAPFPAVED